MMFKQFVDFVSYSSIDNLAYFNQLRKDTFVSYSSIEQLGIFESMPMLFLQVSNYSFPNI